VKQWHKALVTCGKPLYITNTVQVLRSLQAKGVFPVFVSGALVEILEPFASDLGVSHILATRLVKWSNTYTGKLLPPQMIGVGKREAIERFMKIHQARPEDCYAFGDHKSDLPMLECVGCPTVVAGDPSLERYALAKGWPIIYPMRGEAQ
jgi:phosphoserine phosphatase